MKQRTFAISVLALLSLAPIGAQQPGTLDTGWTTDVWVGFTHARDRKVPLVIAMAEVEGCNPCASLSRDIKNTPEMLALRKTLELIWLNPTQDDKHKNVAKLIDSLGIQGYPTTVVLDVEFENGTVRALVERGRVTGYFPREEFMKQLRAILALAPAKFTPPTSTAAMESSRKPAADELPRVSRRSGPTTPAGELVPRKKP